MVSGAPRREVVAAAVRLFLAFVPLMILKTLQPLRILDLAGGDVEVANDWWARLLAVSNAVTLGTTCALCVASDVYGRRPALVVCCVGLVVDAAACVFAPSLAWLVAGHSFAYAFGSPWALLALSFANVGDVIGGVGKG